ncbi:acrosomal protein SP-10 isoform X2 [Mastomys coucha]|uniref:acrosomal protein SP-10 isoform X2 n=1 Tax=Mastomys coucha TaxID=35658 RepID=UPI001262432F|nr:acrosomal protein SP-10 isoform X2 [Mastomys coucha]
MRVLWFLILPLSGAPPGQPDELLDSVDHQASVQQLSSEHFSLTNPSDAESLYETPSREKSLSGHSSSDHESSEHAVAEHSAGEHSSGEQSSEHISSEHTSEEHLSEHTSGEHTSGEHTSGEHTSGEHTSGEHAFTEHTSEEHTSTEHTSSEQPVTEQSSSDQSSEVSSDEVSGDKLEEAGEQVSSETSDKENDAMSTTLPSTSGGTTINCHTCNYMNDDAKCLRGEGICSTQNSQQCMLKKIFEGGKLQYMVQGCENMCPSMNLFSHGTRMQIICCRNEPLCNKV